MTFSFFSPRRILLVVLLFLFGVYLYHSYAHRWENPKARVEPFLRARDLLTKEWGFSRGTPVFTFYSGDWIPLALVPEVNLFLPALLIDLLAPVEDAIGVQGFVEGIRRFLPYAVEVSGGVRYFDRIPGTCLYPYDLDDTSLVLKVLAPRMGFQLPSSFFELLHPYWTPEGVRTWFEEPITSPCIVPGAVPNPVDFGANLHLYLMFERYGKKEEAGRLCEILPRIVAGREHWVWYRYAPLIPYLRIREASRTGCRIPFPPWIPRSLAPHQEIYLTMAEVLMDLEEEKEVSEERVSSLLEELSRRDFAYIQKTPPLLYHNDPTSPIRRFYFSPHYGWGLWLRLYLRASQRFPNHFPLPWVK